MAFVFQYTTLFCGLFTGLRSVLGPLSRSPVSFVAFALQSVMQPLCRSLYSGLVLCFATSLYFGFWLRPYTHLYKQCFFQVTLRCCLKILTMQPHFCLSTLKYRLNGRGGSKSNGSSNSLILNKREISKNSENQIIGGEGGS